MVNSVRGSLTYTAFATIVFLGLQWFSDVREPRTLAIAGVMFFLFTFFMLRLMQRLLGLFIKPNAGRRRGAEEQERGPEVIEATTERPDHVRRRREARRRRRR